MPISQYQTELLLLEQPNLYEILALVLFIDRMVQTNCLSICSESIPFSQKFVKVTLQARFNFQNILTISFFIS